MPDLPGALYLPGQTPADEEQRAQAWRASVARRMAFNAQLWQAYTPTAAHRQAHFNAWQPLILALDEASQAPTDPELDPGVDPALAEIVNAG